MSVQKKIPVRIIIYPKDVENITGRAYRTACTMIQNVRKAFGKTRQQLITISEFAMYMGIEEELIKDFLAD